MAFGSLLLLLDDIASVLDDVALLTKTAAAKTAGVLGDDLALNAQQLSGLAAEREWPVVWAVARGSLLNKAILVPSALLLSAFAPALVAPLLMAGGLYLCLEGVEKLVHRSEASAVTTEVAASTVAAPPVSALAASGGAAPTVNPARIDPQLLAHLRALESDRVRGAVRTDLVLSGEIIVITLGSVAGAALLTQVLVLVGVALLMTVGVYGFVAAIVKVDDLGLWLAQRRQPAPRRAGVLLVQAAPVLMKLLTWVGTAAMFFVGGGILVHGLAPLHGALEHALEALPAGLQGLPPALPLALAGAVVGMVAGAAALAVLTGLGRLRLAFSGRN